MCCIPYYFEQFEIYFQKKAKWLKKYFINFIIQPMKEVYGGCRNHSVSLSVQICVAYIHDPNMTLAFDCKVKLLGFWNVFLSGPQIFYTLK